MHFKKVYGNFTPFFNLIDSVQKTVNQLNTGSFSRLYELRSVSDPGCQISVKKHWAICRPSSNPSLIPSLIE